jgi:hypothetical protein
VKGLEKRSIERREGDKVTDKCVNKGDDTLNVKKEGERK